MSPCFDGYKIKKEINIFLKEEILQHLENIFVGVKGEGKSRYINLITIKSRDYKEGVFPELQKES
ncbi:MAG: hypothetical protein ACK4NF_03570 [Planctomycetota bacterium]